MSVAILQARSPHHDAIVEKSPPFPKVRHLLHHVSILIDVELRDRRYLIHSLLPVVVVGGGVVSIIEAELGIGNPVQCRTDVSAHPSRVGLESGHKKANTDGCGNRGEIRETRVAKHENNLNLFRREPPAIPCSRQDQAVGHCWRRWIDKNGMPSFNGGKAAGSRFWRFPLAATMAQAQPEKEAPSQEAPSQEEPSPEVSPLEESPPAVDKPVEPNPAEETEPPPLIEAKPAVEETVPDTEVEAYVDAAIEAFRTRDMSELKTWFFDLTSKTGFWIDLSLIAASLAVGILLARLIQNGKLPRVKAAIKRLPTKRDLRIPRLSILVTTWLTVLIAGLTEIACPILRTYSLILTCFVFVNLPSKFLHWKSWMSLLSAAVFAVVTLHILGLLDDTTTFLDRYSLTLGSIKITALGFLQGIFVFFLLFWIAGLISSLISKRISKVNDLSPNVRVLLTKTVRISLFVLTFLITMNVMGIQVTTLAVFSGALGIGLGFGLQKVVSNLVSGIILLLDKSIKPGDVIEIEQTYGWINTLNLRYVSVITRDNKEHLIPNEDLITHPVVNWSFSSKLVRIRAPFGISYDSDLRLAIELATKCASSNPRVVDSPAPRCNLTGFGDSSVDFELRFWIEDPHNGVGNIKSDVLLRMWDAFHENGIQFPFPQRDVNLRIPDPDSIARLLEKRSEEEEKE